MHYFSIGCRDALHGLQHFSFAGHEPDAVNAEGLRNTHNESDFWDRAVKPLMGRLPVDADPRPQRRPSIVGWQLGMARGLLEPIREGSTIGV
jgi:hypothetical protein